MEEVDTTFNPETGVQTGEIYFCESCEGYFHEDSQGEMKTWDY